MLFRKVTCHLWDSDNFERDHIICCSDLGEIFCSDDDFDDKTEKSKELENNGITPTFDRLELRSMGAYNRV